MSGFNTRLGRPITTRKSLFVQKCGVLLRGFHILRPRIFEFVDPTPVKYRNQLILFLLTVFWGPPSPPPTADVIYGSPLIIIDISLTINLQSLNLQLKPQINPKCYQTEPQRCRSGRSETTARRAARDNASGRSSAAKRIPTSSTSSRSLTTRWTWKKSFTPSGMWNID